MHQVFRYHPAAVQKRKPDSAAPIYFMVLVEQPEDFLFQSSVLIMMLPEFFQVVVVGRPSKPYQGKERIKPVVCLKRCHYIGEFALGGFSLKALSFLGHQPAFVGSSYRVGVFLPRSKAC